MHKCIGFFLSDDKPSMKKAIFVVQKFAASATYGDGSEIAKSANPSYQVEYGKNKVVTHKFIHRNCG